MDENRRRPHSLTHTEVPQALVRKAMIEAKQRDRSRNSESPEQYAEERVEETVDSAAVHAQRIFKTRRYSERGTEQHRSSFDFEESDAVELGRARVIRQARERREAQSVRTKERESMPIKPREVPAKPTETARKSARTVQKAAQKAQQAKQAQQAAHRAAYAASKAKEASITAKKITDRISMLLKRVIAAAKSLLLALIGGGSVAVIMIVLTVLVAALLSVFGIFSANEASDGTQPLTDAIEQINVEFKGDIAGRIASIKAKHAADETILVYEGDMEDQGGSISNWSDVIGVYAMRASMDSENAMDITAVTDKHIDILRETFYDMNEISYDTELEEETTQVVDEFGALVLDEDGKPIEETKTTLLIHVRLDSMDYRDGAELYRFHADQNESLKELMQPEYYPLFADLLGDVVGDGGTYGFGLDIHPDLPPNALGAQIVEAAKRYIGRSYASMDCSKLARTAYKDCGLTSMNGKSSVGMAKKCKEMGVLFTDPAELQAGDLIFYSRFDPKRGEDYCGDIKRCGTGKCRRWLHIHHVAIYINDEFLIDSTGGNNSVQIRKHWGMDTAKWKWVCFGRPTT